MMLRYSERQYSVLGNVLYRTSETAQQRQTSIHIYSSYLCLTTFFGHYLWTTIVLLKNECCIVGC